MSSWLTNLGAKYPDVLNQVTPAFIMPSFVEIFHSPTPPNAAQLQSPQGARIIIVFYLVKSTVGSAAAIAASRSS